MRDTVDRMVLALGLDVETDEPPQTLIVGPGEVLILRAVGDNMDWREMNEALGAVRELGLDGRCMVIDGKAWEMAKVERGASAARESS